MKYFRKQANILKIVLYKQNRMRFHWKIAFKY